MSTGRFSHIITPFWIIAGLIGTLVVAYYVRNILVMLFLATILAAAISPVVTRFRKYRIPAPLTIMVVYVLLFASISFLLSLIIPPLAQQSIQLATTVSGIVGVNNLRFDGVDFTSIAAATTSFGKYSSLLNQFTGSIQTVIGILSSTVSVVFVLFTLLVMSFHFIMSQDQVAASFAWLLPGTKEEKHTLSKKIFSAVMTQLGSWVRGELTLMTVIGMGTYAGLLLLGIPYALPLAMIAGLLEAVPSIGPTISAIPAIAVAFFTGGPWTGLFTFILYLMIQQFENNLIVPGVMKEAVDIRPLTTIILILVGAQTMGIMGALLAIPFYITVRAVAQILWPDSGPFMKFTK